MPRLGATANTGSSSASLHFIQNFFNHLDAEIKMACVLGSFQLTLKMSTEVEQEVVSSATRADVTMMSC